MVPPCLSLTCHRERVLQRLLQNAPPHGHQGYALRWREDKRPDADVANAASGMIPK